MAAPRLNHSLLLPKAFWKLVAKNGKELIFVLINSLPLSTMNLSSSVGLSANGIPKKAKYSLPEKEVCETPDTFPFLVSIMMGFEDAKLHK